MSAQAGHQFGFACPECGFGIPITMLMLLSPDPIGCQLCGLELRVNAEKSEESLGLVRQLYEATQQVEKTTKSSSRAVALKAVKIAAILAVKERIFSSPLPSGYGPWGLYVGSYVALQQSVLASIINGRMSFPTNIVGGRV